MNKKFLSLGFLATALAACGGGGSKDAVGVPDGKSGKVTKTQAAQVKTQYASGLNIQITPDLDGFDPSPSFTSSILCLFVCPSVLSDDPNWLMLYQGIALYSHGFLTFFSI